MIIGQTMFSVRKGTEHRSDRVLQELSNLQRQAPGQMGHRVLRSFGMSPLASALRDEGREAALGDVHFVFETEWESIEAHDAFYGSDRCSAAIRRCSRSSRADPSRCSTRLWSSPRRAGSRPESRRRVARAARRVRRAALRYA
jgi:heme-degrading monooxygenase HmoA